MLILNLPEMFAAFSRASDLPFHTNAAHINHWY